MRAERLADPMAGVGLNAVIPRGMRAISVNVAGAQDGLIDPGNYVDLVVTVPSDPANPQSAPITRIEEQAVFVLGVRGLLLPERGETTAAALRAPPRVPLMGPQAELVEQIHTLEARLATLELGGVPAGPPAPEEREPELNVTLMVTVEQAERIVVAQDAGELTLALRNDLDTMYAITHGATTEKILAVVREPRTIYRKKSQVGNVITLEEVLESDP